jgi:hypothetical protein
MTISWLRPVLCVALAGILSSGCGGIIDPSKNKVEDIPGVLQVGQFNVHPFSVEKNGEFEVKITQLTPNADAFLGLAYSPMVDNQCTSSYYQSNNFAQLNRYGLGGAINSGRYCLFVSDVGTITQPASYTLRLSRP